MQPRTLHLITKLESFPNNPHAPPRLAKNNPFLYLIRYKWLILSAKILLIKFKYVP